jgi:hypothetical protein
VSARVCGLAAAMGILLAVSSARADIVLTDPGWMWTTPGNQNNSITLSGGANVLVVEVYNRTTAAANDLPQGNDANLTYGGQSLQAAALAEGQSQIGTTSAFTTSTIRRQASRTAWS